MAKKLEGVPVRVNPGLGLTVETEEFRIAKPIDTWAEVSPPTTSNPNQYCYIPVGLDTYSMVDLMSFSLAQSLGITPCDKKKHRHKEPIVEGIGRKKAKTYGFYHLKLCMMDWWNHSVQCTSANQETRQFGKFVSKVSESLGFAASTMSN